MVAFLTYIYKKPKHQLTHNLIIFHYFINKFLRIYNVRDSPRSYRKIAEFLFRCSQFGGAGYMGLVGRGKDNDNQPWVCCYYLKKSFFFSTSRFCTFCFLWISQYIITFLATRWIQWLHIARSRSTLMSHGFNGDPIFRAFAVFFWSAEFTSCHWASYY